MIIGQIKHEFKGVNNPKKSITCCDETIIIPVEVTKLIIPPRKLDLITPKGSKIVYYKETKISSLHIERSCNENILFLNSSIAA